MKNKLLFLSLLFLPTFLIAQKKFFVEPIINPLLTPVGKVGFEEHGAGYSEFNYNESATQEYALLLGRKFFNGKFDAGIGISHKKYRIDIDYAVRHPYIPNVINYTEERFIDYSFYGLRLFLSYQISDRFNVRFTIEANDPYRIEKNARSTFGRLELFFVPIPGQDSGGGTDTYEFVSPSGSPYTYAMPELNFSYTIYKKINLLAGVKYKFTKNERFWTYRLYIDESHIPGVFDITVLNDSRIYPKFLFLYAGFSYQLGFGKEIKKKKKKA